MKKEIIKQLKTSFEEAAYEQDGVEYWLARDLQKMLAYTKWRNFNNLIYRALNLINNGVKKGRIIRTSVTVGIGSGAKRKIVDYYLDKNAVSIISELAQSYKLNNTYLDRNETTILGMLKKYYEAKRKRVIFQYKLENYFFDMMIGEKYLLEFDEPHHINMRQKKIDNLKDQLCRKHGFHIIRISLKNDVIDIILKIDSKINR